MESVEPAVLQTLLATYANTAALKNGTVTSSIVKLDFADVKTANTAFKPLVRDAKFDAGELAIVTYLQAKAYGKPYSLLPVTVVGRGQHHTIAYNPEKGNLVPEDLDGKRVGVRAYTQTTGAWVRGILAEDYGVDFRGIQWVTFEEPHVAEYQDAEWVTRAPKDKQLVQMLLEGEIDAAIVGNELPDARLKHLIPNPEAAAQNWAKRHGGIPINHMLVVRDSILQSRPDVVRELFRMFSESKRLAEGKIDPNALRFGVEANRKSLETIIDYALAQRLLPRRIEVDELFNDVTRALV
jgi:4,5-dihydroxyphthalate decarboxylase